MQCNQLLILLACSLLAAIGSLAHAAVVEKTFNVGNMSVRTLCSRNNIITAVNGQMPGPTLDVNEGDTLIVHVVNNSPYNITIHWHGVFQRLTGWMDGPKYITQCPIRPGGSFTYNFTVTDQEGTLWWHAHASMLRATVYGALVIRPRRGNGYPFPQPSGEFPIILGEYWNANVMDLDAASHAAGTPPNISDAFTVNGRPGDLYRCSNYTYTYTYTMDVEQGKTYMLRLINAALENQLFFKIAGHSLRVVAADAVYTTPYSTDVVVIAPGQTLDILVTANATPGRYYMAARPYLSAPAVLSDNTTTTAIVRYKTAGAASSPPSMPALPAFNDTPTAHRFYSGLTALPRPGLPTVPLRIDEHMFVAYGLGVTPCAPDQPLCPLGVPPVAFAASMNNVSFRFPTQMSLLEAHFRGAKGVYTPDFPAAPPAVFDYTNVTAANAGTLTMTAKGTRTKRLRFNATVEVVLQNTAVLGVENHPLHLHGVNFFVVGMGFGNYNAAAAAAAGGFNLVNPQERNTIAVPVGGWAVIRFRADNPGVWFFHCHIDSHLTAGLAMAFEVADGPSPGTKLPPPPKDFPRC